MEWLHLWFSARCQWASSCGRGMAVQNSQHSWKPTLFQAHGRAAFAFPLVSSVICCDEWVHVYTHMYICTQAYTLIAHMCTTTNTHIHICTYMQVQPYMHTDTYAHVHIYMPSHRYMSMHIYTCTHAHTQLTNAYLCKCTLRHMQADFHKIQETSFINWWALLYDSKWHVGLRRRNIVLPEIAEWFLLRKWFRKCSFKNQNILEGKFPTKTFVFLIWRQVNQPLLPSLTPLLLSA